MKCFLFQRQTDESWSVGKRVGFWLWQLLWVGASGAGIGAVSLLLAPGFYGPRILAGYLERPIIILLNLALPIALAYLLYGLLRRASWAFLLDAALVLGFSVANYYKLAFRDDPLMFADLLLLKEAGNMMGNYSLFLDKKLVLTLVAVVAGFVFLHLFVRGRSRKGGWGCGVVALAGATALVLLYPTYLDHDLYHVKAANYTHLDSRFSASQQYAAHGFVYPFFFSINDAIEHPPEGYSDQLGAQMLAAWEDAPIPEDRKVNVVGIMLEAFQDFSRFGTPQLTQDVYAAYHDLEARSYTGDLVTNIFAGGTVDTERCFLTGYSQLPNFRGNVNAYPWYFRSQGYQTTGMHPCFQWFYNRENVNGYLGFQDYYFVDNYFAPLTGGGVGTDAIFYQELKKQLLERQAGAPVFSFSVTYQGHGPYDGDQSWWGKPEEYFADDAPYTDWQKQVMANYFGSVRDSIRQLVDFTQFLEEQTEPYVLVVFGDHNPWMGDGNSIYSAMGLNLDQATQEGFGNYYSTRYLIWANSAAKEALGNEFVGDGPTLGPYFLMNELFRLCGWEGPAYLQATNQVARQVSVQHTGGMYREGGLFTRELSPEGQALSHDYDILQYYARKHFSYSGLK